MIRSLYIFTLLTLLLTSCSLTNRINERERTGIQNSAVLSEICDSLILYNNLYISKIKADFYLGEEKYDARLSIIYFPDSVILLSAVNAGFEIVRLAVTPDSTVFINKLDKTAVIFKEKESTFSAPVNFFDIEILINKHSLCKLNDLKSLMGSYELDWSTTDIKKIVLYDSRDLLVKNFEFFQKKTGEYIVGRLIGDKSYEIYTNFLVHDLRVESQGGDVSYNKDIALSWDVNPKKYSIIYL